MDQNTFDHEPFSTTAHVERVDKPWGYELHWAQTATYVGKVLHINKGHRLSLQYHDDKRETQMLLSGDVNLWLDDEDGNYGPIRMVQGKGYDIVPYQRHRLEALEDSDVVEVSTLELGTTFRLEDDTNREHESEDMRNRPGRI